MKFRFRNTIHIFTLLLISAFDVSDAIVNETTSIRFCRLCEPPPKMENGNPNGCFKNGLYQWFAKQSPSKGTPDTYSNFVSIFPPSNITGCKIEITYNDEVLEDVLIMTRNGKGVGTNNLWSFTHFDAFQYHISRRINIKG